MENGRMNGSSKQFFQFYIFFSYRMYFHTSRKIWDSFAPSKSGVDLYAGIMRVTLGHHMCHEFFHKADDVG